MTDQQNMLITEIRSDVAEIKRELRGVDGKFGMATKVNILWHTLVFWPVSIISTLAGVAAGFAIKHFFP